MGVVSGSGEGRRGRSKRRKSMMMRVRELERSTTRMQVSGRTGVTRERKRSEARAVRAGAATGTETRRPL